VDDDIDTKGNGTDDSNNYNNYDFDNTIIVENEVALTLSHAPNAPIGEDYHEV